MEQYKPVQVDQTDISHPNSRHPCAFTVSMIILQIAMSIMYGLFGSTSTSYIDISSIIITIFLAMLVIVGFGLHLSYLQSLLYTALGYSFFLVALVIELYPLLNALWSKVPIFKNARYSDSFSISQFHIFLANFDAIQSNGNAITGAIRCGLALIIASSGIIGRSSPFDVLIMGVLGTITFELNRQIAANIGIDQFGSSTIFGFGGFMSLGMGLVLLLRQNQRFHQKQQLTSSLSSTSISLMGSLFIFLFIPILAFQGDNSMQRQQFTNPNTSVSVLLSMGAALHTSFSLNMLMTGGPIRVRDIQNALIAGAVVGGTASYFITNYAFAMICGFSAAALQPVFQHCLERIIYQRIGLFCTYPPSVFAFQSLVGAIFTSIYCARVNHGLTNNFVYKQPTTTPAAIYSIFFISAGIGFVTGLVAGLICKLATYGKTGNVLQDHRFWMQNDGISFHQNIIQTPYKDGYKNIFAPEIAASMSRLTQFDTQGYLPNIINPNPNIEMIEEINLQLDFVDMLQVTLQ